MFIAGPFRGPGPDTQMDRARGFSFEGPTRHIQVMYSPNAGPRPIRADTVTDVLPHRSDNDLKGDHDNRTSRSGIAPWDRQCHLSHEGSRSRGGPKTLRMEMIDPAQATTLTAARDSRILYDRIPVAITMLTHMC